MRFTETPLRGAFVIDLEERQDDRGSFARTFCQTEFADHGLNPAVAQCNLSYNVKAGTLRGMHYQKPPASETKLVRCTQGAIFDVIVDLRPESPTHLRSFGIELTAEARTALYVPELFAHGFVTLVDHTEVFYQMGQMYTPGSEGGFRYDDPAFSIAWPTAVSVIAPKDLAWPSFDPSRALSTNA